MPLAVLGTTWSELVDEPEEIEPQLHNAVLRRAREAHAKEPPHTAARHTDHRGYRAGVGKVKTGTFRCRTAVTVRHDAFTRPAETCLISNVERQPRPVHQLRVVGGYQPLRVNSERAPRPVEVSRPRPRRTGPPAPPTRSA